MPADLNALIVNIDPLESTQTQNLIRFHLAAMQADSPPEHAFALDISGLRAPEVTLWSAWNGGQLCGIGALKELDEHSGEIKSMRTHPDFLRCGVAACILETVIATARQRGYRRLSLETGSGTAFEPALALYRRRGFVAGEAFSDYQPSPFNQFFHLALD